MSESVENEQPVEERQTQAVQNPIITPGDPERWPLLEMPSQACSLPISPEDEEAIALMDALLNALDEQAAGLAAVQVGYPRRIFLLRNGRGADGEAFNTAYINPVVVARSRATKTDGEACLSLPHFAGRFERPKSVTLEYMDIGGEFQRETFTGFWARAVMHEMDHLNGTLITQHVEKQIAKQPRRTRFGMKITPHRQKVIAQRRANNKRARAARRANRG